METGSVYSFNKPDILENVIPQINAKAEFTAVTIPVVPVSDVILSAR